MTSRQYLGIDLGGTNTKIGICEPISDGECRLVHAASVPTQVELGPGVWAQRVIAAVNKWNADFYAVGVGSPGPLDTQRGVILEAPNLGRFEGFDMKAAFQSGFQKNVYFENDANCGALAEHAFGSNKNSNHIVVLTLGTGIGSGVISEGKLIRGVGGFATEFGHMIINCRAPRDRMFEEGSLEGFTGGRRMVERFAKITSEAQEDMSVRSIFKRAEDGETVAVQFVEEWTFQLAVGLANVCLIFNPEVVVFAGGVTSSWHLVDARLQNFLKDLLPPPILQSLKIVTSELGEFFGVHGAVALAMQESGDPWLSRQRNRSN